MTPGEPAAQDRALEERFAVPFVKALVLAPDGRFLLQRRAKTGDPYEGFWELPGGKMRHGETVEEALSRELREEAGLALREVLGQPGRLEEDRFGRAGRALAPLAVVEVASGPWPFLGLYFACHASGEPGASAEGDSHRYLTPEGFFREFLAPGASGPCATLDRAAMRQILHEKRLDVLRAQG